MSRKPEYRRTNNRNETRLIPEESYRFCTRDENAGILGFSGDGKGKTTLMIALTRELVAEEL